MIKNITLNYVCTARVVDGGVKADELVSKGSIKAQFKPGGELSALITQKDSEIDEEYKQRTIYLINGKIVSRPRGAIEDNMSINDRGAKFWGLLYDIVDPRPQTKKRYSVTSIRQNGDGTWNAELRFDTPDLQKILLRVKWYEELEGLFPESISIFLKEENVQQVIIKLTDIGFPTAIAAKTFIPPK